MLIPQTFVTGGVACLDKNAVRAVVRRLLASRQEDGSAEVEVQRICGRLTVRHAEGFPYTADAFSIAADLQESLARAEGSGRI
jgi:hypothetical protein